MTNEEKRSAVLAELQAELQCDGTGQNSDNSGTMNTLPVTHFRPRLSAFIQFADRHASAFVPIWALVYIAAILPDAGRPLWFDELITYYVSNAPSLHRLFEMINHVDLNPPLSYLAMRTCLAALGGGGGDCAIDIDGVLLRRRCVAV